MITQNTAGVIWNCYQEIANAKKLLEEMEKLDQSGGMECNPRDGFGRERRLEFGIPSGDRSHRLIQVHPSLAISVIRAHIANKTSELSGANESARLELNAP